MIKLLYPILVPADSSDQEVQQLVKKWLHENIMVKLEDCSENLRAQVFDLWNNPDDMHAWYIEEESNRKSELEKKEQLLQELYGCLGNSIRSIKLIKKEKRMMNF